MHSINQVEKNQIAELKKAIIKVIVFFDIFDYPLTLNEIWQNLEIKCELTEIMAVLENEIQPRIENKNGFYFLSGKEKIIEERLSRYNFADRKFKRAKFVAQIFKFIPWIKMIGVNSFGSRNLRDKSDIDLFIITEDKRIWLTRFFCVGIIKLLGWRPQTDNRRDKICLSFYASLSALNLEKLRLDQNDLGFTYWLAGVTPLYNVNGAHQKLINANQWLTDSLPNLKMAPSVLLGTKRHKRGLIDFFINWLEQQFKKLQLKILPQKLKSMMNRDTRVVINDQIIKLHSNDRREEYRGKILNF